LISRRLFYSSAPSGRSGASEDGKTVCIPSAIRNFQLTSSKKPPQQSAQVRSHAADIEAAALRNGSDGSTPPHRKILRT
jgi:hypothetical protein